MVQRSVEALGALISHDNAGVLRIQEVLDITEPIGILCAMSTSKELLCHEA